MPSKNCCVKNCNSKRDRDGSLFRFPTSDVERRKWLKSIKFARLYEYKANRHRGFVCRKHFEQKWFSSSQVRSRLRFGAFPTLFSEEEILSGIPRVAPKLYPKRIRKKFSNKLPDHDHCYYKVEQEHSSSELENTEDEREDDRSVSSEETALINYVKRRNSDVDGKNSLIDHDIENTEADREDDRLVCSEETKEETDPLINYVKRSNSDVDSDVDGTNSLIDHCMEEVVEMPDVRACRCCLIAVVELEPFTEMYRRVYNIFTGLECNKGDGYPQYICMECKTLMKKMLAFRRKCRRASYVLKEIKNVKNAVTLEDILTVDRKKTNLESPLGYWALRMVPNEQTENYEKSDGIVFENIANKTTIVNVRDKSIVVMDIPPGIKSEENVETIEETEEMYNEENVESVDKTPLEEEQYQVEEPPPDIDLNDVFKDLKERESNESEPSESEAEKEQFKKTYTKKRRHKFDMEKRQQAVVLSKCTITCLSPAEQKEVYNVMSSKEERVKCYCTDYEKSTLPHECSICKHRFHTKDELETHTAERHMYEYTCKGCLEKFYTFGGVIAHQHPNANAPKHQNKEKSKPPSKKKIKEKSKVKTYVLGPIAQNTNKKKIFYLYDYFDKVCRAEPTSRHTLPGIGRFVCQICYFATENAELMNDHKKEYLYKCKLCGLINVTMPNAAMHMIENHKSYIQMEIQSKDKNSDINNDNINKIGDKNIDENIKDNDHNSEQNDVVEDTDTNINQNFEVQDEEITENNNMDGDHNNTDIDKTDEGNDGMEDETKICEETLTTIMIDENIKSLQSDIEENGKDEDNDKENHEDIEGFDKNLDKKGDVEKPSVCEICGLRTRYMYQHKMKMHFREAFCYHCALCGRAFIASIRLYYHQLMHHDRIHIPGAWMQFPYKCQDCTTGFVSESAYKNHLVQMKHTEDPLYDVSRACMKCRLYFETDEEHKEHITTSCRYNTKTCTICKEQVSLEDFKSHEEKHEISTLCPICGVCVKPSYISIHIKEHGKREKKLLYKCKFCAFGTRSLERYCQHVVVRHTAKPYQCVTCGAFYTCRTKIRNHILKRHVPDLLFECELCPRRFAHEDYLATHCRDMHNIKITKTIGFKIKGVNYNYVLAIYPHTRLDLSLIEPEYLDQLKLYLCDYKHENIELVDDYRHYMVKPEDLADKPFFTAEVKKKKIKRKKSANEANDSDATMPKRVKQNVQNELDTAISSLMEAYEGDGGKNYANDIHDDIYPNTEDDNAISNDEENFYNAREPDSIEDVESENKPSKNIIVTYGNVKTEDLLGNFDKPYFSYKIENVTNKPDHFRDYVGYEPVKPEDVKPSNFENVDFDNKFEIENFPEYIGDRKATNKSPKIDVKIERNVKARPKTKKYGKIYTAARHDILGSGTLKSQAEAPASSSYRQNKSDNIKQESNIPKTESYGKYTVTRHVVNVKHRLGSGTLKIQAEAPASSSFRQNKSDNIKQESNIKPSNIEKPVKAKSKNVNYDNIISTFKTKNSKTPLTKYPDSESQENLQPVSDNHIKDSNLNDDEEVVIEEYVESLDEVSVNAKSENIEQLFDNSIQDFHSNVAEEIITEDNIELDDGEACVVEESTDLLGEETERVGVIQENAVIINGMSYDVINQDGKQYVVVDGKLYCLEVENSE